MGKASTVINSFEILERMPFEQGVSLKASLSLTDGHFVYWQIWINHQPPISMLKRRMVFGTFQASGGVGLPSVDSGCGFGQRIMGRKRVVWKVLLVGGEKMFRGCHGRCPGTAYIYTLKNIYVYIYMWYIHMQFPRLMNTETFVLCV